VSTKPEQQYQRFLHYPQHLIVQDRQASSLGPFPYHAVANAKPTDNGRMIQQVAEVFGVWGWRCHADMICIPENRAHL